MAGATCSNVATNTLLQGSAPEQLRGRVISLYTATRFGFDALGGLLAGVLAHWYGPAAVLLGGGVLLLGFCGWQAGRLQLPSASGSDAE